MLFIISFRFVRISSFKGFVFKGQIFNSTPALTYIFSWNIPLHPNMNDRLMHACQSNTRKRTPTPTEYLYRIEFHTVEFTFTNRRPPYLLMIRTTDDPVKVRYWIYRYLWQIIHNFSTLVISFLLVIEKKANICICKFKDKTYKVTRES